MLNGGDLSKYEKYKGWIFWLSLALSVLLAFYVNLFLGIDIVYTHIFYIPIILAGLYYPKKAIYVALFLGALHVFINLFAAPETVPHSIIRAGVFLLVALVVSTLTEIKDNLNRKLAESNKRASSIIEFDPDPTMIADAGGRIIAWNKAMEDMTGVEAKDMLGKGNYEYSLPFYGERKPLLLDLLELSAGDINDRYKDVTVHDGMLEATAVKVNLRGKDAILWGRACKLYDPDGKVIGAIESVRDVTAQKRMEAKLQQQYIELKSRQEELSKANAELMSVYSKMKDSEEKYRMIMASVNDGIVSFGLDGKCAFVNARAGEILGYSEEDMVGRHFIDFISTEHREMAMERFQSSLSGMKVAPFELNVIAANNAHTPIEINGSFLNDAGGRIVGIIVTFRDISERRRSEEALRQARDELEQRVVSRTLDLEVARSTLSAILDTIPTGVVVAGSDTGRISYANRGALAIFGGTIVGLDAEARGLPYAMSKPGGIPMSLEELPLYRSLLHGEHIYDAEVMLRQEDYRDKVLLISSAPVKGADGQISAAVASIVDITERNMVESALRESEEKFRVLAETAASAIFIYQGERLRYVNPATERITGYSKGELLAMPFWGFIHPSFQDSIRNRGFARLRGEPVPGRYEVMMTRKSGEERWLDIAASLIEYNGAPAVLMTAFDISERRRAEDALSDAKEQVELFLDLMGHDINNINQVAIGYLELAQVADEGEARKLMSRSRSILEGSSALIDTVRKLQQAAGGNLKTEPVDLDRILSEIRLEYSSIPGRDIRIVHEPGTGRLVLANRLLKDVFSNIVGNAIKHSTGQLEIRIVVSPCDRQGIKYYSVAIEDNGPGIPDELKGKIFSRLKRGRTMAKGSGLGLYLVKTLVKDFKGTVWIEDRVPGDYTKGSRFVVMLPEADE